MGLGGLVFYDRAFFLVQHLITSHLLPQLVLLPLMYINRPLCGSASRLDALLQE